MAFNLSAHTIKSCSLGTNQSASPTSPTTALDFVGVDAIFDGPVWSYEDNREAYGEQRINLVGWLHGQLLHLTYTDDGETMRAISLRKAEKHEIRQYVEALAR